MPELNRFNVPIDKLNPAYCRKANIELRESAKKIKDCYTVGDGTGGGLE